MRRVLLLAVVVAALVPAVPSHAAATDAINSTSGAFSWMSKAVAEDSDFGEPSIDVDHGNRVFITAPGGAGVQMWRTFDQGKTFNHKEIAAPNGGGDSEIEFLKNDIGFTADLEVTDSAISRSNDHFDTIANQQPVGIEQDRQWLGHRGDRTMFLAYHDFVVEAELLNRSDDGGQTWTTTPVFISPRGSAPGSQDITTDADQGVNTFSGPIAVDQDTQDVYVVFAISSAQGNLTTGVPPFGQPQQVILGVSHDDGKTFNLKLITSGGTGTLAGLIFPWVTIDRGGNVYVSWAGKPTATSPTDIYVAASTDHGETFKKPIKVNAPDGGNHLYSTISGGDAGVVDVAWYTGTKASPDDPTNDWYVDFAQIRNANTDSPTVSQSRVMPNKIHHGDICLNGLLCILGGDRSLLDFFQIQVGPDGVANIAFANNGSPDDKQRIWYARQTGGPLAGSGLMDVDPATAAPPAAAPGAAGGGTLPATGGGGGAAYLAGVGASLAGLALLRRRRRHPVPAGRRLSG